jgi:hypothetical protein
MKQHRSAALAALTLVAGCGGGSALLALLPYVEPIGGQWVLQSDVQTTISPQDDCLKDASGAPVAGGLFGDEALFLSKYSTTASLTLNGASSVGTCAGGTNSVMTCQGNPVTFDVVWSVDERNVTLSQNGKTCASGTVQSPTLIQLDNNAGVLRNQVEFNPRLDPGIWVDHDDAVHRFKFNGTIVCEYRSGAKTGGSSGTLFVDASISTTNPPTPAAVRFTIERSGQATETFDPGAFEGASRMRLTSSRGGTLVIERQRDNPPTDCQAGP